VQINNRYSLYRRVESRGSDDRNDWLHTELVGVTACSVTHLHVSVNGSSVEHRALVIVCCVNVHLIIHVLVHKRSALVAIIVTQRVVM